MTTLGNPTRVQLIHSDQVDEIVETVIAPHAGGFRLPRCNPERSLLRIEHTFYRTNPHRQKQEGRFRFLQPPENAGFAWLVRTVSWLAAARYALTIDVSG